MERRIALSIAAAFALVITAGGAAFAANFGMLGGGEKDPVGELSAATVSELMPGSTSTSVVPEIVVIDEYITIAGSGSSGRTAGAPSAESAAPAFGAPASPSLGAGPIPGSGLGYDDDGDYDDDDYDDHDDDHDDDGDYDDDHDDDYDDHDDD